MQKTNRNRDEQDVHGVAPVNLPTAKSSLLSAHLGVTQQTLRHVDVISQHLQHHSLLLDLVTIQLYQQLIKIYGVELDQQITSDTILTNIKNLVTTQFEQNDLWQVSAKEIWSSLVLRTIQDMQRDLGNGMLESLDWEAFNRILFQYLFNGQSETIDHRIRHLEEFYAQSIASKIVQNLNLNHQPILALKRLLGLQSTLTAHPTPQPNLHSQQGPIAEIPSEFPILMHEEPTGQISFVDQLQSDLWQSDARSLAYLRYHAKHNRNHYLEHYISSWGDLETLPWEAAEQILHKFGLNAVKLHFILVAHTMQQPVPWHTPFPLKASELIAALGWQPDPTADLPHPQHHATSLVYALSCLLVKFVCLEQDVAQIGMTTPVSKLWEVLIAPQGEFDWTTGRIETPDEVHLTVRSGLWTTWLTQPTALIALNQFGQLALQLLHLNGYANDLLLRLVIYLMLNTRIQATHPNPHEYQVKTLLETVLSEAIVQQAQANLEQGHALFADWNQALRLLAQLDWCHNRIVPNPVTETNVGFYVTPYPKWLDPAQNVRKPRGWVSTWLEQKLVIKPLLDT